MLYGVAVGRGGVRGRGGGYDESKLHARVAPSRRTSWTCAAGRGPAGRARRTVSPSSLMDVGSGHKNKQERKRERTSTRMRGGRKRARAEKSGYGEGGGRASAVSPIPKSRRLTLAQRVAGGGGGGGGSGGASEGASAGRYQHAEEQERVAWAIERFKAAVAEERERGVGAQEILWRVAPGIEREFWEGWVGGGGGWGELLLLIMLLVLLLLRLLLLLH